jgi:hypothetical protein
LARTSTKHGPSCNVSGGAGTSVTTAVVAIQSARSAQTTLARSSTPSRPREVAAANGASARRLTPTNEAYHGGSARALRLVAPARAHSAARLEDKDTSARTARVCKALIEASIRGCDRSAVGVRVAALEARSILAVTVIPGAALRIGLARRRTLFQSSRIVLTHKTPRTGNAVVIT